MGDLKKFREAIDDVDGRLLGLLNERARLAQQIGAIKARDGRPVYVPERAEQLIRRLSSQSEGPLGEQAIRAIYIEIMSAALALEKKMVIACDGQPGGGAHFAARQHFGSSIRFSFHHGPGKVLESLLRGEADCGVVPESAADPVSLEKNGLGIISRVDVDHGEREAFVVLGRTQATA